MTRPGISTKNTEKNTPRPEILEPQENTEKIPQKYQKCAFWYFGGIFSVFSGYFGRKFWESIISGRNVFFRYFSWKFRVGPSRGSVAGRGVLNDTIAAIPHIARYLFLGSYHSSRPKNSAMPPPLVLSFTQAHLCDTPFCYVSRDSCAIRH